MNHSMTWAGFYLICFALGFCFSFFSFVLGGARTGRLHLPHYHGHVGHLPAPLPSAGHGPAQVSSGSPANSASSQPGGVSPFNLVTLTAFLAWFGGAGYLLTRYSGLWVGFGLGISILCGLIGGGIVFLFLSRVLISHEENMDSADYEMVGVLGTISSPIRAGGTGEMVYAQMGTRRVCGARSDQGTAVAKGTEVVVTRYDKGIAYVRLWSEMAGDEEQEGL
jgi:membrane protein implicated in regulation of membrane protease activity